MASRPSPQIISCNTMYIYIHINILYTHTHICTYILFYVYIYICILHTYISDIYNTCIVSFHMHTYKNKYIHKLIYASVCIYHMLYTCGSSRGVRLKQCCSTSHPPKKDLLPSLAELLPLEPIKPNNSVVAGSINCLQYYFGDGKIPPLMGNPYTWY